MSENLEKKKALEMAMSQIEKQFGKGSVMKLGEFKAMEVEAIPTGALSLDMALGIGGVPRGRIIEVFGPESSGKTTLALHIVAEAQKMGGDAAFIDQAYQQDEITHAVTSINKELLREVVSLCDQVTASNRYGLLDDFQGLDLVTNENGKESVFAIQYSMNDGTESAGRINWSNLLNSPGGGSP